MSDEIYHSTQISSKKHAVNKTTTKLFASRRLEAAVAYRCNPSVNINLWGRKHLGSVPSRGELFLVSFYNCQTTIHEDPGSIPCSGELFTSNISFCILNVLIPTEYTVLILQTRINNLFED